MVAYIWMSYIRLDYIEDILCHLTVIYDFICTMISIAVDSLDFVSDVLTFTH